MQYYNLEDTHEYKNIGQPMEQIAQQIIKNAMNVDIIQTCKNSDYDFTDSNNITYEIKADRKSHITNNFFITYGQKTIANTEFQPACISKSKSDYHMLLCGDSFYKVKTDIIRFLIFTNDYRKVTRVNGRNEDILGILLKVDDIKPYATIYNFT